MLQLICAMHMAPSLASAKQLQPDILYYASTTIFYREACWNWYFPQEFKGSLLWVLVSVLVIETHNQI